MKQKTGWIPALALSLLAIAVFFIAGMGYALWIPLGLALAGWLAVWAVRRGSFRIGRILWAAVGAGCLLLASTLAWIGIVSAQSIHGELPDSCDTVIVLGTGIDEGVPTRRLQMRLDTALDVAGHFPDAIIIPSGGQDPEEPVTEAQAMAAYMESRGIASGRVILEPRSTSTYENLIYSRPLAQGDTVVVTSGFHTLRANLLCRRMEWDVVTIGSRTPWPECMHWWARECLALWKDIIKSLTTNP